MITPIILRVFSRKQLVINLGLIASFCFLIVSLACSVQKNNEPGLAVAEANLSAPFKLISATAKHWQGGRPESGRGTEYFFMIKVITTEKIVFDSAWVNDKGYKVFVSKKRSQVSSKPIDFGIGDTITLRVSDKQIGQGTEPKSEKKLKPTARLNYMVSGKKFTFNIPEIVEINMPIGQ